MPKFDFSCECGEKKPDELCHISENGKDFLDWDTKKPITCSECGSKMIKDTNLAFPYMHSGPIHATATQGGATVVMKRLKKDNQEEVATKRRQDKTGRE